MGQIERKPIDILRGCINEAQRELQTARLWLAWTLVINNRTGVGLLAAARELWKS